MKDPELLARIDERVNSISEKIDGFNEHIRALYGKTDKLATKQSWIVGAGSTVGAILSAAIVAIFSFVISVFR